MNKEIEIPEGYEARIEGNKVILEPKESDDEKIRKELISYVNKYYGEETKKEVLAYLEKHKEGNLVEKRYIHEAFDKGMQAGMMKKPAEWSEEDKEKIGRLRSIVNDCAFRNDALDVNGDYCEGDYGELDKWLKRLTERFNIQPKQEWVGDDEYKVDVICRLIEHATIIPRSGDDDTGIPPTRLNDKYKGELKAFVKALRPQPKYELTELDKNILEAAIAFVEQNDHFNYWGGVDKHTVLAALRSLKPHWKPSEEQMKALERAEDYLIESDNEDAEIIGNLYNELQKQM